MAITAADGSCISTNPIVQSRTVGNNYYCGSVGLARPSVIRSGKVQPGIVAPPLNGPRNPISAPEHGSPTLGPLVPMPQEPIRTVRLLATTAELKQVQPARGAAKHRLHSPVNKPLNAKGLVDPGASAYNAQLGLLIRSCGIGAIPHLRASVQGGNKRSPNPIHKVLLLQVGGTVTSLVEAVELCAP